MAKVKLSLERQESYCLLAAQEYLRQLMISEEGGIPLISSISPEFSSTSSTLLKFFFSADKWDYLLKIEVNAGDIWPKRGTAHLMISGLMEAETGVVLHYFELRGHPAEPQVVFTTMRGGG